jgi:hypothetical protein
VKVTDCGKHSTYYDLKSITADVLWYSQEELNQTGSFILSTFESNKLAP